MSRTFAYARFPTIEQETQNQIAEIKAAGFAVEQRHTIAEPKKIHDCLALVMPFRTSKKSPFT
jgi:hypothetical protein